MLIKYCFMIGRMLLCVRERSSSDAHNHSSLQRQFSSGHGQKVDDSGSGSGTRVSHFLPTSRRIVQFSNSRVWLLLICSFTYNNISLLGLFTDILRPILGSSLTIDIPNAGSRSRFSDSLHRWRFWSVPCWTCRGKCEFLSTCPPTWKWGKKEILTSVSAKSV